MRKYLYIILLLIYTFIILYNIKQKKGTLDFKV